MDGKGKARKPTTQGQSVVEFALVSFVFIALLILTMNAILAFTVQQYLSFATFMAARAYQASARNPEAQETAAFRTLAEYIPGLPNQESQTGIGFPLNFPQFGKDLAYIFRTRIPEASWGDYGVVPPTDDRSIRIEFRVPLMQLPLGEGLRERFGMIDMSAQSFLGREVTQEECRSFFQGFLRAFQLSGTPNDKNAEFTRRQHIYMEDNGC